LAEALEIERVELGRSPQQPPHRGNRLLEARELDAALSAVRRLDPEPGLRLWALEEVLGDAPAHKSALTAEGVDAAIEAEAGNLTAAAARLGVSRGKLLRFRKRANKE